MQGRHRDRLPWSVALPVQLLVVAVLWYLVALGVGALVRIGRAFFHG